MTIIKFTRDNISNAFDPIYVYESIQRECFEYDRMTFDVYSMMPQFIDQSGNEFIKLRIYKCDNNWQLLGMICGNVDDRRFTMLTKGKSKKSLIKYVNDMFTKIN